MANPIIKILRGATAPSATLQAGQLAMDQVAKNLYLGVEVAGVVTNEIVGGNGTFATHTDVTTAVTNATGSLGTMSTQDADAVAITGGTIDGTTIGATTPSTGKFTSLIVTANDITMSSSGNIDMQTGRITNLGAPVNANDSVRLTDLDTAISALGSVFHYVGDLSTNIIATGPSNVNDLTLATDQTTGSYYRVDVAGTYTAGSDSFALKVGDAIVKTSTGWQKLDNVDVVVSGTTDEISVTGDENAGYTVSIDPVFSGRVGDLETKTQNIDLALTTAGTTTINGDFTVDAGGGAYMIRATGSVVEFNESGNSVGVRVHSTLDLVDSDWGLGDSTDGYIALQAAGHLVGVNHTYGGSSQMSKIENFIIDGGVY
jgi:hypothetical protein